MTDDLIRRLDAYVAGNSPDDDAISLLRACRTALTLRTLESSLLEQRVAEMREAHMRTRIALQDLMSKHRDTIRYLSGDT